jgi:hypothetical protein
VGGSVIITRHFVRILVIRRAVGVWDGKVKKKRNQEAVHVCGLGTGEFQRPSISETITAFLPALISGVVGEDGTWRSDAAAGAKWNVFIFFTVRVTGLEDRR